MAMINYVVLLAIVILLRTFQCFKLLQSNKVCWYHKTSLLCQHYEVVINLVDCLDDLSEVAKMIAFDRCNVDPNILFGPKLLIPYSSKSIDEMRALFYNFYQLDFERLVNNYNYVNGNIMNTDRQLYAVTVTLDNISGDTKQKIPKDIVGYMDIDNSIDCAIVQGNPIPYITDFIVSKPWRNRGIGIKMLQYAENLFTRSITQTQKHSQISSRFDDKQTEIISYLPSMPTSISTTFGDSNKRNSDIFLTSSGLHLSVEIANQNALNFYLNFGFIPLFMEKLELSTNNLTFSFSNSDAINHMNNENSYKILRSIFSKFEIELFLQRLLVDDFPYDEVSNDKNKRRILVHELLSCLQNSLTFREKLSQGYDRLLLKKVL